MGDTFWADSELISLIWLACMELAMEGDLIQETYSSTTVASTQEYAIPTNAYAVKRVTCDGRKLEEISFDTDDEMTLDNNATTATGAPTAFTLWNDVMALRPIPDDAYTLKTYTLNRPQTLTISSTIELKEQWHTYVKAYVNMHMAGKEKVFLQLYDRNKAMWDKGILEARKWRLKNKARGGFAMVRNEETRMEF